MGENKHSPTSILKHMAPASSPHKLLEVELQCGFKVKHNVLVMPSERMREIDGGALELLVQDEGPDGQLVPGAFSWRPPPEGQVVVKEGTRLSMEHLDFTVTLVGIQADNMIQDADGRLPARARPLVELFRQDAEEYVSRFEPNKAGPRS